MRHELRTEIDIPATPEEVWSHLIDFDAYAEWNPFITSATGSAAVGQRLAVRMQPPGGRATTFRPTVTAVAPSEVFEWLGHLGVPGLFDGRHRFELVPTASGTRLTQRESFTGILVRPLRRSLDTRTRAGFDAMNTALSRRVVESRPPGMH
jgi:hypothetical protein